MPKPRNLAVVAVAVLALTGCSAQGHAAAGRLPSPTTSSYASPVATPSPGPSATPTPTPTPTPTVSVPRNFATPRALVNLLNQLGASCTGYKDIDRTGVGPDWGPSGLLKVGNCSAQSTDDTSIGIFKTHANALGDFDYLVAFLDGIAPVYLAIGGNWSVNGSDPAYVQRVAQLLGGEYKTG